MKVVGGAEFTQYRPVDKSLVVLMIDEVAIDERLAVDISFTPMPFMGLCRHWRDPSFNTMDDAIRIKNGLKNGIFHLKKSMQQCGFSRGSYQYLSLNDRG